MVPFFNNNKYYLSIKLNNNFVSLSISLSLILLDEVRLHLFIILLDCAFSQLGQYCCILTVGTFLHFLKVSMNLFRLAFQLAGVGRLLERSLTSVLLPHVSHIASVFR